MALTVEGALAEMLKTYVVARATRPAAPRLTHVTLKTKVRGKDVVDLADAPRTVRGIARTFLDEQARVDQLRSDFKRKTAKDKRVEAAYKEEVAEFLTNRIPHGKARIFKDGDVAHILIMKKSDAKGKLSVKAILGAMTAAVEETLAEEAPELLGSDFSTEVIRAVRPFWGVLVERARVHLDAAWAERAAGGKLQLRYERKPWGSEYVQNLLNTIKVERAS